MSLKPAGVEQTWTFLSQQRLSWAFHAYDRFINSLSQDVRERFPKGDEQGKAYVVVFGKTQVGKTTLILDLMGISGESLKRVSKVLRGGRKAGKSATATAMEYRRSTDNHWRCASGVATDSAVPMHCDDAAMETALGEIREHMFKKCLQAKNPFIIWIPNDCFDSDRNGGFSIRMLDLPGDHATDAVERKHVQQMAQRYIPNADLILLVGKGDDLSFLRPASLELPNIEDWQIVPNRFRIVTTFSFTAQSVRDAMAQQKTVNAEFFRQRLLGQIRTFGLKLSKDAADTRRFFTLEFGDSWLNAKQDLVATLKPIISGQKDQLHHDIKASATPSARLRNAVDVHVTVRKIKESYLKDNDETLGEVTQQRSDVLSDCTIVTEAYKQAQIETDAAEKFLDALIHDNLKRQVQTGMTFDMSTTVSKVNALDTNTSKFKTLINIFTSDLQSKFLSAVPTRENKDEKKFWDSLKPRLEQYVDKVQELVDAEFSPLRAKFSEYSLTEYYPRLSNDFSNDKKSMFEYMHSSERSVSKWATKLWDGWAKKRLQQLTSEVEAGKANKNALQSALKERQRALGELDRQIDHTEQQRHAFIEKMQADEASSRQFIALLQQAYLDELRARRHRITQATSTTHAFIELLATDQLINERNKLINILS